MRCNVLYGTDWRFGHWHLKCLDVDWGGILWYYYLYRSTRTAFFGVFVLDPSAVATTIRERNRQEEKKTLDRQKQNKTPKKTKTALAINKIQTSKGKRERRNKTPHLSTKQCAHHQSSNHSQS